MKTRLTLLALFLWFTCLAALAQDIDLSGNVSWFQSGSRIRIEAGSVYNNSEFTTGPLRLQIWATTNVYDGVSDIEGYPIGTAALPRLRPQRELVNIVKRVAYRRPLADYYYTTITLEERRGRTWFIVDSQNFVNSEGQPSLVNLGHYAAGEVVELQKNPGTLLTFFDHVFFQVGDGRAKFRAGIANDRRTTTGPLRLALYASTNGYNPDEPVFYAWRLATQRHRRITAESATFFDPRPTTYRPPPAGEWFMTMTLEEFDRGWVIIDHYNFEAPRFFEGPTVGSP